MSRPKFKVGQVVMYSSEKKPMPFKILEIIKNGDYFYRFDSKNCIHESGMRALTDEEKGA